MRWPKALRFGIGMVAHALLHAAAAAGQLPPCGPQVRCPWALTLATENDNKLFGLWHYLSGGHDGNDTGRTHGLRLALNKTFARGISMDLQLSTDLFTRRDGIDRPRTDANGNVLYRDAAGNRAYLTPEGYVSETGQPSDIDPSTAGALADIHHIGIVFNEINKLSLIFDNTRQPQRGFWRFGGTVLITNREGLSPGGTGQQKIWHSLRNSLFRQDYYEYDYHSDGGGVDAGFSVLAAGGADWPLWLRKRCRLYARLEGGMLLSALPSGVGVSGTNLHGIARLQLDLGRADTRGEPDFTLRVVQESNAYVTIPAFEAISRIEAVVYTRHLDIFMSLNFYYADPVRPYYVYNANNSTTEFGLRAKFGG